MSEFDHNGQQESLMQIFMSYHRELFGLWKTTTHHFFFVCIVICLLRYYVYIFFLCKLELLWAWPSYTRIPTNQISYFPIPILKHMRHLHYVRVGCCNWSHADSRIFPFVSASHRCVKSSIAGSCRASFRVLPFEVLRESVSPSLFSLRNW